MKLLRASLGPLAAVACGLACAASAGKPTPAPAASTPPPSSAAPSPLASASASTPASGSASASESAVASASAAPSAPPKLVCNGQTAFPWLIRSSYIPVGSHKAAHEKTLEWRSKQYGYVKPHGDPTWSAKTPHEQAVDTTFMGIGVRMHKKIVPALACVEEALKVTCAKDKYKPGALAGIRDHNTYQGGEVTNHLYGIAIDIDPTLNSCCGCVTKWKKHPLCKKKVKSIYERMVMPQCWVEVFEKYGFYWLGHDVLQDTMHFEFLADPDKIMVPATGAP